MLVDIGINEERNISRCDENSIDGNELHSILSKYPCKWYYYNVGYPTAKIEKKHLCPITYSTPKSTRSCLWPSIPPSAQLIIKRAKIK